MKEMRSFENIEFAGVIGMFVVSYYSYSLE